MKILKYVLVAIAVVFAVLLGLSVVGFVYNALWYLFGIGVLAIGGYTAYKFLSSSDTPQLEGRTPVSEIEYDNDRAVKQLEEYKKKLLK